MCDDCAIKTPSLSVLLVLHLTLFIQEELGLFPFYLSGTEIENSYSYSYK